MNQVYNITVVGGGTAGWLTAAYFAYNGAPGTKITVIEDSKKGPIGVGEGTFPSTMEFLRECGIHESVWMPRVNATNKFGIKYVGWGKEDFWLTTDAEYDTRGSYVYKNLAQNNKCMPIGFGTYPTHFDALLLAGVLKEQCLLRDVKYVDTNIADIKVAEDGNIEKLIGENNEEFKADLFIDCTGFSALLINKTLGVEFEDYTERLIVDSAVVCQMPHVNKELDLTPYTRITAVAEGWIFRVPVYNRTGNGLVYSSKITNKEDAEKTLRDHLGYSGPVRHIPIRTGKSKKIAHKNVMAIGLSAGFIEPLEATGIFMIERSIIALAMGLNKTDGYFDDVAKDFINKEFSEEQNYLSDFIQAHYILSKAQGKFWDAARNTKISSSLKHKLESFKQSRPSKEHHEFGLLRASYPYAQWIELLEGLDFYDTKEIVTDYKKEQLEKFMNVFPNHYEYLRNVYDRE